MDPRLKGLYLLTDERLTPYDTIETYLTPAFDNGCKLLQFRDKGSSEALLLQTALKIRELCKRRDITFIINDNIDLAREVDADGVHLGKDDEEISLAKRILGKNKIVGVSCYGDVMLAKEMEHRGADYVAFGAFFSSSTKPDAPTVSPEVIKHARKIIKVPICAIGGITASNAKELIHDGADMVAVISDVWRHHRRISERCRAFSTLF